MRRPGESNGHDGDIAVSGIARFALSLGRYHKRALLIGIDMVLLEVIVWVAYSWRYGEPFWPTTWILMFVAGLGPVLSCLAFFHFGLYRMVTRYMDARAINAIAAAMVLSTLIWSLVAFLVQPLGVSRLAIIAYPIVGTMAVWTMRQIIGGILRGAGVTVAGKGEYNRKAVIIYGAGRAGVRIAQALERSDHVMPIAFVDRNPTLWRQYIGGYRVHRPDMLRDLAHRHQVGEIVVALDSASRQERGSVLAELEKIGIQVRILPDLADIAAGRVTISDLRPVDVLDLLGRDAVPPNAALLARNVRGKSVLVTGAGGSIGSELCRQILTQQPSRLIMLDASENALYEIEAEMKLAFERQAARAAGLVDDDAAEAERPQTELVAVLGSVLDEALLADVLEANEVRTVYHAAAYKHVPIIERNAALGVMNNTFGTWVLAKAAIASGVERMVLISTDKAVRPSSVMGASKRLAEMILQSLASQAGARTIFTMVRFGNVLDSSGSVIRRFRQQIANGGPVTVTHRDMIRYFMSIPEAAGLVIQAGAMATGGEVFLLDMGKPMRIEDLAKAMIRLSGLDVKDAANPTGHVAIEFVGLRPGEKLKEELLIGDDSSPTEHPRIFMSREPSIPPEALEAALADLGEAVRRGNAVDVHEILRRTVEGYRAGTDTGEDALAGGDSVGYLWREPKLRTLH